MKFQPSSVPSKVEAERRLLRDRSYAAKLLAAFAPN